MKNTTLYTLIAFLCFSGFLHGQESSPSMDHYYRVPVIEPGKRNIILQNRSGNRLTVMMFENSTELEFTYKPNAFRRKDFRSRNFSNRDNFTLLFPGFYFPDMKVSYYKEFHYDPFFTVLETETPHGAGNRISFLNIADENVFALSSDAPLLLEFSPHSEFIEENGLLMEKFHDRGEDIISFIKFDNYEENRYRRTTDGSYVLQLFENEVILLGGEENEFQVNRALTKLSNLSMDQLNQRNERMLDYHMNKGVLYYDNPDFQEVIDLNHRIVYSGMDAGGACFGALNRIYYLIWVRDGAMTASLMARSGNPELIETWTPFLLANPSYMKDSNGEVHPEFNQMVGTRWTKSEPDGLYFAVWSLFTYFQTTGKDDLFYTADFDTLLSAIDYYLKKNYDSEKKLIITDTHGETALKSNPYFGYDVVNGNFERNQHHREGGKAVASSSTFYNNVNTWNLLKMMDVILDQRDEFQSPFAERYRKIAGELKSSMAANFVNKQKQIYYRALFYYDDGSTEWVDIGNNPWELSWAQSLGPYFPDLNLSIRTARAIKEEWGSMNRYGYCPWNCVANKLYEFGMSSNEYEKMLSPEIRDALMLTEKYPMPGGLTEYYGNSNSWRALPFSAGSFFFSISGQNLQSLPMGIAVRASNKVDSISGFQFRLSTIHAKSEGKGDAVDHYSINGVNIEYSLQIPSSKLKAGKNDIEIHRTGNYRGFRLFSSTAILSDLVIYNNTIYYEFSNPIESELVFENIDQAKEIEITDDQGTLLEWESEKIGKSNKSNIYVKTNGDFKVSVKL